MCLRIIAHSIPQTIEHLQQECLWSFGGIIHKLLDECLVDSEEDVGVMMVLVEVNVFGVAINVIECKVLLVEGWGVELKGGWEEGLWGVVKV